MNDQPIWRKHQQQHRRTRLTGIAIFLLLILATFLTLSFTGCLVRHAPQADPTLEAGLGPRPADVVA